MPKEHLAPAVADMAGTELVPLGVTKDKTAGQAPALGPKGTLPDALLTAPTHLPGMGSGGVNLNVVANTAYLMPIGNVVTTTPISRLSWGLLIVIAGNYDVGIYFSDDEVTFTRLISKGSTAIPVAGNIITSIASSVVVPVAGRRWYYALALSTASTVEAAAHSTAAAGGIPGYTKAASFALPASLTGMTAIGATPLPVIHGAV